MVREFIEFKGPAFLEVMIDPDAGVYPMVGPGQAYDEMITGDHIASRHHGADPSARRVRNVLARRDRRLDRRRQANSRRVFRKPGCARSGRIARVPVHSRAHLLIFIVLCICDSPHGGTVVALAANCCVIRRNSVPRFANRHSLNAAAGRIP